MNFMREVRLCEKKTEQGPVIPERALTYCAESGKAFVGQVRVNRVEATDDYVEPQIELEAVEEQRLV